MQNVLDDDIAASASPRTIAKPQNLPHPDISKAAAPPPNAAFASVPPRTTPTQPLSRPQPNAKSTGTAHVRQPATTRVHRRPASTNPRRRAYVMAIADVTAAILTAANLGQAADLPAANSIGIAFLWLLLALGLGRYRAHRTRLTLIDARGLFLVGFCLAALISFAERLKLIAVAPTSYALVAAITIAAAITRMLLCWLGPRISALGEHPVVLVGATSSIAAFLARHPVPVAAACPLAEPDSSLRLGIPLHPLSNLAAVVAATGSRGVLVIDPIPADDLRAIAWQLEPAGGSVTVAPLWNVANGRVRLRPVGDTTALEVAPPTRCGWRTAVIQVLDTIAALLGLIALLPVFAIIAIAIVIDDPGPVFFRQLRTGFHEKRFLVWKFRTMCVDADARKAELCDANQYHTGTLFKMANDPRITRVGRWLRKSSLDELPQLINVVAGQMALVGPRPTSTLPEDMPADYRRRTLVRPGLTGLWQVSGRSNLSWEDSVRLDLQYVENQGFGLNMRILAKTVPAVFRREGAY